MTFERKDAHVPNTCYATEVWLKDLGCRFRDVWFLTKKGWAQRAQVDDPVTFDECVDEERRRIGAKYVLYEFAGEWVLVGSKCGHAKSYPNRAAAEMVAIHGG